VFPKGLIAYKQHRDRERHEALNRMAQKMRGNDKVLLPEE
jgi:hypothetical protein